MATTRSRLAPLLAAVIALPSLASCRNHTVLTVQVVPRPGVREATKLEITFSSPSESGWKRTFVPEDGGPLFANETNSEVINIIADDRRGPVTISAAAFDLEDTVVGRGTVDTAVRKSTRSDALLNLDPTPARLNARKAKTLGITSTSAGRQLTSTLASDGAANYSAATWRHCEEDGCEIVARAFDGDAVALDSLAGSKDEFFVTDALNEGTEIDMPAIGMHSRGGFAVAYRQTGLVGGLFVRAFRVEQGTVTLAADQATRLTATDATNFSTPDVVGLDDDAAPAFVSAWAETIANTHQVRALHLDDGGQPFEDDGVQRVATTVAEISAQSAGLDTIRPAIAGGPAGAFMVAWIDDGGVRARLFDKRAEPLTGELLPASEGGEKAGSVDVATLREGYIIVWDAIVGEKEGQKGHRGIQVRRYDSKGSDLDNNEYTLSTETTTQRDPTVAVDSNGYMLVTWVVLKGSEDPVGELRTRLIYPNGMPFGDVEPLEAELVSTAVQPSVAAVARGGYQVSLLDRAGDEQSSGGITVRRDQIVGIFHFPALNASDGLAGHSCNPTDRCKTLICVDVQGLPDQRCVAPCSEAGEVCPLGGRCLPVNGDQRACLYDF